MGQLGARMSEIEKFKEKPIIVVCATGNRSTSACGQLKKGGFDKVFSLGGGISAWIDANLPLTTKS
jgi:rhodanese-related sulfurtransferase